MTLTGATIGVRRAALSQASVRDCFLTACALDVEAFKPGNVSVNSAGHGMVSEDFELAAEACADYVCALDMTLGERILSAIQATRAVVDKNVNLGIVLVCAPLAQAALTCSKNQSLKQSLATVLGQTTVRDAEQVYEAIRLAEPGGLGEVTSQDIRQTPSVNLVEAMRFGQHRDRIAEQYVNGYREVFDVVIPTLLEFRSRWGYHQLALTCTFLKVLARLTDTHIVKKYGEVVAVEVGKRAMFVLARLCECELRGRGLRFLFDLDASFKRRGINPGTTADLLIAGVFFTGIGFCAGYQWGIAHTSWCRLEK